VTKTFPISIGDLRVIRNILTGAASLKTLRDQERKHLVACIDRAIERAAQAKAERERGVA
jgi:hypothetical protein